MVGVNSGKSKVRKIDRLAVVPAESGDVVVIPGGVIYGSGDRYAVSQLDARDDAILERVGGMLRGMPGRTDSNLKQVLEVTDRKIERAYIGKRGVELAFSDGTNSNVNVKAGLPAALADGAELYVEDESMRPFGGVDERLQDKISSLLERNAFHDLASLVGLEVAPPEVDGGQYSPMAFLGAATGIKSYGGKAAEKKPESDAVGNAIVRGVSIEVEFDEGVYTIGHTADDTAGSGDELLRAAYALGDGDTAIKTRFIGHVEIPAGKGALPMKARATEIYLEDASGEKYAVQLQSRPVVTGTRSAEQDGTDIMERTLVAEAQGLDSDVYKRFEEMGPIADTASLEAKLMLDKGAKIRTIYLDLVKVTEGRSYGMPVQG